MVFGYIRAKKNELLLRHPPGIIAVVLYEGLGGAFEIFLGVLVLVATFVLEHNAARQVFENFIARQLADDPEDLFFNWVLSHSGDIVSPKTIHIGWFILILGLVKIFIAAVVWYRSWKLRKWAMVLFGAIALYGAYSVVTVFSIVKFGAVAIDFFILYYFWKILPKHIEPESSSG